MDERSACGTTPRVIGSPPYGGPGSEPGLGDRTVSSGWVARCNDDAVLDLRRRCAAVARRASGWGGRGGDRIRAGHGSCCSTTAATAGAGGSRWPSDCETDLAECATWISFGSRSSSTLTIRSCLVDGGPRPWAGLSWATPRTSSRLGRRRIGCRACCSCRFRRRRQARTDSILTSVRSIKPQKSNVSFPSVLGGPMSGSVTRRGWYSQTLKAMSSASFVDGFGPMPRSRRHTTTLRRS